MKNEEVVKVRREKWNENIVTCSDCGIQWKKIGKTCPVCFAPKEKITCTHKWTNCVCEKCGVHFLDVNKTVEKEAGLPLPEKIDYDSMTSMDTKLKWGGEIMDNQKIKEAVEGIKNHYGIDEKTQVNDWLQTLMDLGESYLRASGELPERRKEETINMERADDQSCVIGEEFNECLDQVTPIVARLKADRDGAIEKYTSAISLMNEGNKLIDKLKVENEENKKTMAEYITQIEEFHDKIADWYIPEIEKLECLVHDLRRWARL